jgi:hypothetical protein
MIVCPLCEHAQPAGPECEVCGRELADVGGGPVDAPQLEGLEPTALGDAGAPPAEAFPDLEPTGAAPVTVPAEALIAELVPTRAAPLDPLDPDPVPLLDLERTAPPIPDEERTPFPALVACRYCGTEGGLGERRCARCGMRLPIADAFPGLEPDDGAVRCGCGMLVQGGRCRACGARRAS